MVTKISRKLCLESYPKFPVSDDEQEKYFFPNVFASHVLTNEFEGDVEKLCQDVTDLVKSMEAPPLVFLGETEMPWLSQDNEATQVKEAFQYFRTMNIDVDFNGGFLVDNGELPEFLKHLFWLTRLNASFPIVYFTNKDQGIVGNICKYGNLHLSTLNERVDKLFNNIVNASKFVHLEGKQC